MITAGNIRPTDPLSLSPFITDVQKLGVSFRNRMKAKATWFSCLLFCFKSTDKSFSIIRSFGCNSKQMLSGPEGQSGDCISEDLFICTVSKYN